MENNDDKFLYSAEQMRIQRHDFMNYLQVIFGYIQINKPQEAIRYIKNINLKMSTLSIIFNLGSPEFGMLLQEFIANCSKNGIEIEFYTELEYISSGIFSKNIDEKRNMLNYVINILSDEYMKPTGDTFKLFMNLYEDADEIIIIIGESQEIIDLINIKQYPGESNTFYKSTKEDSRITLYKKNNTLNAVDIKFKKI
jgi:hypothetical protein